MENDKRRKKNITVHQIELGHIDVPIEYGTLTKRYKNIICDKIIDSLLIGLEEQLDLNPEINRITFLNEVFDSSLITNEEYENYEVCQVIIDCKKRLNDC